MRKLVHFGAPPPFGALQVTARVWRFFRVAHGVYFLEHEHDSSESEESALGTAGPTNPNRGTGEPGGFPPWFWKEDVWIVVSSSVKQAQKFVALWWFESLFLHTRGCAAHKLVPRSFRFRFERTPQMWLCVLLRVLLLVCLALVGVPNLRDPHVVCVCVCVCFHHTILPALVGELTAVNRALE